MNFLTFIQEKYELTKYWYVDYEKTPFVKWYYPLIAICLYLSAIYFVQQYMKDKKPKKFTSIAIVHNIFLCVLSFFMVAFSTYEGFFVNNDLPVSIEIEVCDSRNMKSFGRQHFWFYIFYLSKFYELIDTLFQAFRKKNLSFLHVYHHISTLMICWLGVVSHMGTHWLAVITNGGVHVVMYYYYACSCAGIRIWWKKYITQIQLIQFIFDMIIPQLWVVYVYIFKIKCTGTKIVYFLGEFLIIQFFFLFVQFYIQSYQSGKKKRRNKNIKKE